MFRTIVLAIAAFTIPFSGYTNSHVNATSTNYWISQNNHQTRGITTKSLGIGGIKLSMSEAQVRKILGRPIKTENSFVAAIGNVRTLKYAGIKIDFAEGDKKDDFTAYQITVTSAKYVTVDGIKVGDTQSKLVRIYGQPVINHNGKLTNLSYTIDEPSPAGLNFTMRNRQITGIFCFYVMN